MKRHTGGDEDKGRKIHVHEKSEAEAAAGAEAEEEIAPCGEAGPAEMPDAAALQAELDESRRTAKEFEDKFMRLYADTENFKKRMSRESAEREKYYNEGIIRELLPVLDNLERAIAHAGENGEGGGLVEGIRMVRKQFRDVLAKFGVREVECIGLQFDPATQQAMMQVETADYEEGAVVEEFQKGYYLNDRILRPAMVTVAKKPAAPAEGETE